MWKFRGVGPARTKAGRGGSLAASSTELVNVELGVRRYVYLKWLSEELKLSRGRRESWKI